jgi:hypothetical protein
MGVSEKKLFNPAVGQVRKGALERARTRQGGPGWCRAAPRPSKGPRSEVFNHHITTAAKPSPHPKKVNDLTRLRPERSWRSSLRRGSIWIAALSVLEWTKSTTAGLAAPRMSCAMAQLGLARPAPLLAGLSWGGSNKHLVRR